MAERELAGGGNGVGPANGASPVSPVTWDHAVQFYDTDDFLCDSVAQFIAEGLELGEPIIVLATQAHRDGLVQRLAGRGLDWDRARRSRRLRWVDARAALETIMIGRVPDPARFDQQIGGLIRANVGAGGHERVRAFGELVDLLWREGNADAALALEDMWNDLGKAHSLSLMCAYSRGNIYKESAGPRYREVCDRHAHVLRPENQLPPVAAH